MSARSAFAVMALAFTALALASPAAATHARPKGAAPLEATFTVAYQQCTAPNRTHGPPLAFPSCSSPQQTSPWLTVGTGDSNGQPAKSVSKVKYGVKVGDPMTPADEADLRIQATINDVRNRSDLTDYTGEVQVTAQMRITDHWNAPAPGGGPDPATVVDLPLPFNVTCAATADTTVGSTCDVDTTLDTVIPNAVPERKRAIWELNQVQVTDGGGDGQVATAPNTLFMVEGLFVP
jgi:hypothetical protein